MRHTNTNEITVGTICKTATYGWKVRVLSIDGNVAECTILKGSARAFQANNTGCWNLRDLDVVSPCQHEDFTENQDGDRTCLFCGQKAGMTCPECGSNVITPLDEDFACEHKHTFTAEEGL